MSPATIEKPEPLYPGAPILLTRFRRTVRLLGIDVEEVGDVRVQDYGATNVAGHQFKVGQFLPGIVECPPGDTPKVWPEVHQYAGTFDEASDVFARYVEQAKQAGWREIDDDA